jgi:hypothetical protein
LILHEFSYIIIIEWDKVVILHGLRYWFQKRSVLPGGGQRISRHYYDLYWLLESDTGRDAANGFDLGADCVRHARMFFISPDLNLATAVPGTFRLSPTATWLRTWGAITRR